MKVVITGGSGFLGARLARGLLGSESLSVGGAADRPVEVAVVIDRVGPHHALAADGRVRAVQGDLYELLNRPVTALEPSVLSGADVVFHLAAAVSAEAEADFDLGMRSNLATTQALLENCRALGTCPVVVFASSLAVYGGTAEQPLPEVITDSTLPIPQSSYGIQKFIGEQLVADYTRKGFVRGRSIRLMTVTVRPGQPNGAASSFLSGIIREPLSGVRSNCPVPPATLVAVMSPARAVDSFVCAATATDSEWGGRTAVAAPAITVSVAEMVAALGRVAGPAATDLIDWMPEPGVATVVTGWPAVFDSARATRLGLRPDDDFDSIIRSYLRDR